MANLAEMFGNVDDLSKQLDYGVKIFRAAQETERERVSKLTKYAIPVHIELTGEQLDSLVISALEDGSRYWMTDYNIIDTGNKGLNEEYFKVENILSPYTKALLNGGKVTIAYFDTEMVNVELTLTKLLAGVGQLITNGVLKPKHIGLNMGKVDRNIADLIIQFALFNKVVYQ